LFDEFDNKEIRRKIGKNSNFGKYKKGLNCLSKLVENFSHSNDDLLSSDIIHFTAEDALQNYSIINSSQSVFLNLVNYC
jgi:hypothetical protein